jgi:hypothetical protein
VATKAADNGGRAAAVEKSGFCVFSILMSKKEAVCPDSRSVPAVFQVSGFYCNSLKCTFKTLATNNFGMRNFVQFMLEVEVRFFLINQSNYVIKLTYLSESKIVSPIF